MISDDAIEKLSTAIEMFNVDKIKSLEKELLEGREKVAALSASLAEAHERMKKLGEEVRRLDAEIATYKNRYEIVNVSRSKELHRYEDERKAWARTKEGLIKEAKLWKAAFANAEDSLVSNLTTNLKKERHKRAEELAKAHEADGYVPYTYEP